MSKKIKTTLATIGLLIVIFILLKSVFGIGKIGLKNLFSKGSSLPTLKCTFDESNGTQSVQVYDLKSIYRNDPIRKSKTHEEKKKLAHGDGKFLTLLSQSDTNYSIEAFINENGIAKGYTITINRKTGQAEFILPSHHPTDGSMEQVVNAIITGQKFKGMCVELENKNL